MNRRSKYRNFVCKLLWVAGTTASLFVFTSVQALGSGFVVARFGGEHGHPTTDNLSAIYYNPGALSLGSGTRLMIDGTFAHRSVDYTRPASAISSPGMGTPDDAVGANSGKATLRNWAASPFFTVASDFGIERLTIAVGLHVPFGGGASWDKNTSLTSAQTSQYPGVIDGQQRWWSIDSSLKSIYLTLAAAYQVTDQLHFGIGINRVATTIDTVRARGLSPGSDDLVNGVGDHVEARSYLNASSTDYSVSLGVVYQPTDQIRIGYSYQSQPGFGEMRLKGDLKVASQNSTGSTPSALLMSLPDVHRLGVQFREDKEWEVRLFADYVRWSVFDHQCVVSPDEAECDPDSTTLNIEKNWEDAFGVRLGGSYWVAPEIEVYVGGGYDANAAPDLGVDPSLFDMDKFSAALGARFSLIDDQMLVGLTFTQVIYMTREIEVTLLDGQPSNGYEGVSAGPSAAGEYAQSVSVGNLYVQYQF